MTHLIIPDAHAHPQFDNLRFKALGKFIADIQPELVVCIGDFADMPSLSAYDKGKKSGVGRSVKRDIECVIDAQEKMFNQIAKARSYSPDLVMCLGNHDARIERAVNDDPTLEGTLSIESLKYEEFGWDVRRFLEPATIDGITYAHYFASGVSGRPISGEGIGRTLCNKLHVSAVQGHSHVFDHSERTRIDGQKIFGLSVGCFTHPDMVENWNRATHRMWWRGVVVLEDVDGRGYYDGIRAVTLRKLLRDYL